jgi:uncharacterized protein (TIGR03067 family)
MVRLYALLGLLAVAMCVSADPAPTVSGDLNKLQGSWAPLQCELEGKGAMPGDIKNQVRIVFDKNQFHLYFKDSKNDKDGNPIILRLALANVTLDETTVPKTIGFEFAEGPLKGKKSHGIYELAGNQLKMCYGSADKPKPARFESPVGSGYFNETWARHTK